MPKQAELGAGKPRGVNDRGVDELVKDDDVVLADERGDGAEGGGIAGGKGEGGFSGLELGEGRLQLVMWRQRPADEPGGAGAGAKLAHGTARGFLDRGMGRKAQVIVR